MSIYILNRRKAAINEQKEICGTYNTAWYTEVCYYLKRYGCFEDNMNFVPTGAMADVLCANTVIPMALSACDAAFDMHTRYRATQSINAMQKFLQDDDPFYRSDGKEYEALEAQYVKHIEAWESHMRGSTAPYAIGGAGECHIVAQACSAALGDFAAGAYHAVKALEVAYNTYEFEPWPHELRVAAWRTIGEGLVGVQTNR